jgi:leader peptidase (prepilin peptidase) / N-methyltransferase
MTSTAIAKRYRLAEISTALLLMLAVVLVKQTVSEIVLGLVLVAVLVPITVIDIDQRIIPNRITAPAALAAIVIGLVTNPAGVPEQLAAGFGAGAFMLLLALIYPKGMGLGDVKLAAVLGLYLGRSVVVALFVGALAAAIAGFVVISRHGVKKGRKTGVPFGPFLAFGAVVALMVGPTVMHWYVHSGH